MLKNSWLKSLPHARHSSRLGTVVWFTGLSGSGKSTIASAAAAVLSRRGIPSRILDGDILRRSVSRDLGFSKADRDENVARAGALADRFSRQGAVVFVALVSPYAEIRNTIRGQIANFVEVYVNAPLAVCEQRDPKGLYRLARQGVIPNFTGISDPYESPQAPDVECRTDRETLQESVGRVLQALSGVHISTREIAASLAPVPLKQVAADSLQIK